MSQNFAQGLVHLPIILLIVRPLKRAVDPASAPWLCVAVLLIVPIMAAAVTYFVFERPVTRWLQAWMRFAPPVDAQSASAKLPVSAASVGLR